MSIMLTAVAGLAVGALLATLVTLHLQRTSRRQIELLMARLENLEAEDAAPSAGSASPATAPVGDVLAGRTSHVQWLVGADGEARGLADKTIVCVHGHLEDTVTPRQLADELNVSLRTLERGLAASLDCTPRQLIAAMKMRQADALLRASDLTVSEVAYRLGFASPSHFSRRFKAFYRVAPSEVIARHRR
jgi:AraC-like DNA-binding protein